MSDREKVKRQRMKFFLQKIMQEKVENKIFGLSLDTKRERKSESEKFLATL